MSIAEVPFDSVRHFRATLLMRTTCMCLCCTWVASCVEALQTKPQDKNQCQKIAGCWESAVYGSWPLITSTPGSSPPERTGLDNITSQPWSDATFIPKLYLRYG